MLDTVLHTQEEPMTSQETTLEEIRERLIKLEGQNRRLKQMGAVAVVVAASLLVMGQALPTKTVEANAFVLKDNSGKVRARLSMRSLIGPEMVLLDQNGKTRIALWAREIGGSVSVFDNQEKVRGSLYSTPDTALMSLSDPQQGTVLLGAASVMLSDAKLSQDFGDTPVTESFLEPGTLTVSDAQGYKAVLGINETVTTRTGQTHKTSASALVMYDKGKKVIWQAP